MVKPNFIIIGAMKCATTTLHDQLVQQPGFVMSDPKEPNFFSDDENYAKGMDWYYSLFDAAVPGDLCGESSTHYTKLPTFPNTIGRIKEHVPDAKFIYVMRHPIERLVSQYIHEWSQLTVGNDINEAIKSFLPLIQYSQYSMQIRPYLETFGADKVLLLFSENFRSRPQQELEKVCQFLEYTGNPVWQEDTEHQHLSSERLRDSAWRDAIVEQPVLRTLRRFLVPKSLRTWVRGFWQMKKRPELNPESIQYLENIFNEDLAVLGKWMGIELTCSNFKEAVKTAPYHFQNWQPSSSFKELKFEKAFD